MNGRKSQRIDGWMVLKPEPNRVAFCFAALVLVAIVDWLVGFRLNLSLAYLMVIAVAAWGSTARAGMVVAGIATASCVVHEFMGATSTSVWEVFFNALTQGVLCLAVFLGSSGIRRLKHNLENEIADQKRTLNAEIEERRTAEEQLHKSLQQLRQLADNIGDVFWMRNANELRIGYVSPAYERIWGRPCRELYQSPALWMDAIHDEDRERVTRAMQSQQVTGEYNEEYRIVRTDGSIRWIRDRSFPIRNTSGAVFRIVGIAEDVTEQRRLERQILEVSDREQARIGQDLHDSLCQKLVSLAFDSRLLEHDLSAKSLPEAQSIRRMSQVLRELIAEARSTARGLFPVHLDADGLQHGLQELATKVTSHSDIDCRVELDSPALVQDGVVATQLYRIAQEAVTNAIRHSHASRIWIRLSATEPRIDLEIRDNGIGLPAAGTPGPGMGLHIMEYRARTIGARLTFSRPPGTGTVIRCLAPQSLK